MDDCLSIHDDGTCEYGSGKPCLCKDQVIRGFFGPMNVCGPVAETLGIEQLHGTKAEEWKAKQT